MKRENSTSPNLKEVSPGVERFRAEVLYGLQKSQKELPSKYFYDEKGADLFELICSLDEYYIPRTEAEIMEDCIDEIVDLIGPCAFVVEYGSGSCEKVRILLDNLIDPAGYAPIDISRRQLVDASRQLTSDYPDLEVLPVCADYSSSFDLPVPGGYCSRTVVYFPGSTISNFDPVPAVWFLEHVAAVCSEHGGLLMGVDLKKDVNILNRAYNDSQGVTAAFNLNLLERINRELGTDFDLDAFEHYAFYHPGKNRIEMHLVSMKEQEVHLDNVRIPFQKGESIWTESSYKFNLDEFEQMAARAGFRVKRVWTDRQNWFSVQYLENCGQDR